MPLSCYINVLANSLGTGYPSQGHGGKPTSAERSWEVPGCTIPRADNASQNGVTFQDVAGETAVLDLVAYVEPRSVENSFQYLPRVSTRVTR